jgi:type II secretory pathway predicted ATPase ExeA
MKCLSSVEEKGTTLIILTGETGSGKTVLLRSFLGSIRPEAEAVLICYPPNDHIQLLQMILFNLGIKSVQDDIESLRTELRGHLSRLYQEGRNTILIIDEAQNLGDDALQEIVHLLTLKANGQPLIKVILFTLPRLLKRLSILPEVDLKKPWIKIFHLKSLQADEVYRYIHHRLVAAGCLDPSIFPEKVVKEISHFSSGIPRLINMICDAALLHGYFLDTKVITMPIIKKVIAEHFYERDEEISAGPARSGAKEEQAQSQHTQRVLSEKTDRKIDDAVIERPPVPDTVAQPNKSLSLTVLFLEKSARMRVHMENRFKSEFNLTMLSSLEDLFKALKQGREPELRLLVADAAFFFTKGGDEDPAGKDALERLQKVYGHVPLIMTSTLPLSKIRTRLSQRGIPFLLHKPDLSLIDLSEANRHLNIFFNELKNSILNVYSQFNAFYKKVTGWDGKSRPMLSTRTHPVKTVDG